MAAELIQYRDKTRLSLPIIAHANRFAVADFYLNWLDLKDQDVMTNPEGFRKDYGGYFHE
jgi:hypothetical protein